MCVNLGLGNDCSLNCDRILTEKLSKMTNNEFDIFPHLTYAALDTICESAMGRNVNAQLESDSAYVKALFRASDLIFNRMRSPWLWGQLVWLDKRLSSFDSRCGCFQVWQWSPPGWELSRNLKVLHDFTDMVIKDRREAKKRQSTKRLNEEDELVGKKKRLALLGMNILIFLALD